MSDYTLNEVDLGGALNVLYRLDLDGEPVATIKLDCNNGLEIFVTRADEAAAGLVKVTVV